MSGARTRNRTDGSASGPVPKFHQLGWSRIKQVAIDSLIGPARSDEELLATARVMTWKERHTYI